MPSPKELAKALARQDSVTQQPRNRFLGAIADAAGYVSDQADRYVVPERDPLFGGMRGGDLLPLRNVNRLLDDLSYGGRITTGRGQTAALRPEVVDLAGVTGAMMPVSKGLGKAALREAALDPRMSVSHGLLDTTGLENRGRDLIRGKAEELAQRMHEAGVTVDLQHSGSAAGPSSYIKVVGMPDIRISGHSKGAFNSGGVLNVASPEEFDNVLAMAIKKQQKYNSQKALMEKMYEDAAIPIRLKSADKKIAKGLKLTNSEQDAVNVRAMPKPIDVGGAMMQRPKTEFEILHDTAQRNAALPVEQGGLGLPEGNTGMDRAAAMDWNTPAYHGSGEELRVINNEKLKRNAYGKGLHSASDPELANIFANHSSQGQNVSPLLLRVGNQASKEDYKNAMNQVWDEGGHDATKIRQLLIDKGFDTVTYNHGDFHYPQGAGLVKSLPNQDLSYATLNPSQVRSRFAAFDPMRRHEADILAGVGVGGMLDPQAIAEALRQQDRK